jgi:hypothetical protein
VPTQSGLYGKWKSAIKLILLLHRYPVPNSGRKEAVMRHTGLSVVRLKRRSMVVLAVLAFLLIVGSAWFFNAFNLRQPVISQPVEQPVTSMPDRNSFDETSDAANAAAVLTAFPDDPSGSVAMAARGSFDASVALPPGSELIPEPESWAPDSIGGGTMNVVLSINGEPNTRYVAIMIVEDGSWKVLGTVEQSEGATP